MCKDLKLNDGVQHYIEGTNLPLFIHSCLMNANHRVEGVLVLHGRRSNAITQLRLGGILKSIAMTSSMHTDSRRPV